MPFRALARPLPLLLVPLLLAAAPLRTDTPRGFEGVPQRWMAAFNSGDLDAVGEIYSADARMFPPTGAVASGRDAIVEAFAGLVAAGASQVEIDLLDSHSVGTDAYLIGRYAFRDAAGAVVAEGYGMLIARESDGVWRIERHLSNRTPPPT